jgi:flagellar assembly protein FliH
MDPIQRAEAETLDNARQRAEEMIAQANKEAGDLRLAAHDEMMAVRAAAHEEGLAQAKQEMKSALEACATIIDQVQDWKKSLFAQSEPLILGIVHEIAQVIFGEGVVLDDQALQENLSRIVENASSIGDLKIFLNPHDAAMLNPAWREHETIVLGSKVQVIPADAISCGGAYVQGQMGTVDARVETQLRSVLESLAELKLQNEAGT